MVTQARPDSSIGSYCLAYGAWILGLVCPCIGFLFRVRRLWSFLYVCKRSIYGFS